MPSICHRVEVKLPSGDYRMNVRCQQEAQAVAWLDTFCLHDRVQRLQAVKLFIT